MTSRRLPKGTRVDPVQLGYAIERDYKRRFEDLARRAGVSSAGLLERVIDHLDAELDDRGLPTWWPAEEEGLPIDTL